MYIMRLRPLRALVPEKGKEFFRTVRGFVEGIKFGRSLAGSSILPPSPGNEHRPANPLRDYFMAHKTGPGISKWMHYFDIYHRHLQKFRGRDVRVLEIGVYSGGSLRMWREYFGPKALVYGADIEPACSAYESERTTIFI